MTPPARALATAGWLLAAASTAAPGFGQLGKLDLSGVEPRVAAKVGALQRVVGSQPDSAAAWGQLAMNLDVHGFDVEAVPCYARVAELDPGDFRWPYYHAVLLAELGDPGARRLFRAAAEIGPDYPALWVRYGNELAAWGELVAARVAFGAALERSPTLLHAHLGLAQVALAEGRPEVALDHAAQAVGIEPTSSEARGLMSEVSRRLGWLDEARRQAAWVPARATPLEDPLYAALAAEGVSSYWFRKRGRALLEDGRFEAAATELRAALQAAPDAETHNDLGLALQRLGRPEEASEHHRAAIALRSSDPEAHQLLGLALTDLGDHEGAIDAVEQALALRPSLPGGRLNLGTLYQRAGRHREAVEAFRSASASDPADPRPPARLAWLLATSPDPTVRDGEQALTLAHQALELLPAELPEPLDVLAAALAESGQYDQAVSTAARARDLARRGGRSDLARRIEERLALYAAGRPYREGESAP